MTDTRANRHAKQMTVALYEGDIDKARHEFERMEKSLYGHSPKKGREERFQSNRKELFEPYEPKGTKSMERLP